MPDVQKLRRKAGCCRSSSLYHLCGHGCLSHQPGSPLYSRVLNKKIEIKGIWQLFSRDEPGARGNGAREREGKCSGGRGASVELRGRRVKTLPQCSFLPLLLCSIRRLSQVGFTDSKSLATLNDSEVPDAAAHWRVVMSPEHSVTVSRKPRGYSTGPHS